MQTSALHIITLNRNTPVLGSPNRHLVVGDGGTVFSLSAEVHWRGFCPYEQWE
jgi:hypothetical protein